MVIDSLCKLSYYNSLNPRFAKVVEYLKTTDLSTFEPGKYEVDGKEIFINILDRDLKTTEAAALEVHDKYIDIQILLSGDKESFGWKQRCNCTAPRGEMDTDKDVLFFDDASDTYVAISPGEMGIFFPQDAHAPLVGEGHVKKAVVKVLI